MSAYVYVYLWDTCVHILFRIRFFDNNKVEDTFIKDDHYVSDEIESVKHGRS